MIFKYTTLCASAISARKSVSYKRVMASRTCSTLFSAVEWFLFEWTYVEMFLFVSKMGEHGVKQIVSSSRFEVKSFDLSCAFLRISHASEIIPFYGRE